MKYGLMAFLALCMCCSHASETPDPRVRTFVYPTRIVAQTVEPEQTAGWRIRCSAEKMERLLEPKHGQVCEVAFGRSVGSQLVNRGEPPFVILDFGRELHGGIQLGMSPSTSPLTRLRLRFGESVAETMSSVGDGKHATNNHAMRDFELEVAPFGSIEVGNTGFRFLRIDLVSGGTAGFEFIRAVSLMRPMKEIGCFRSSDERLNRVYETAVRTVHLCCQDYLWDGIKRDRLVWMGDAYPETRTILAVFGAASVLPETLDFAAATTPSGQWMQTMSSYTLWWIRNLAEWYRFTGDLDYLKKHERYLRETLVHVKSAISPTNTWTAGGFLDWPTKHNPQAVAAGMQGHAASTFDDAAFLLDALNDPNAAGEWRAKAEAFRRVPADPNGAKSAAAILALSGCRTPREMFASVLGRNGHRDVSTFYGYFMLEAMSEAGQGQRALDTVRDYWGAMLDVGATSFWEDFNLSWTNGCFRIDQMPVAGKADIHGDYGEFCYPGFRHSLCHGWAGGPAAWCINRVLGIRPLDVGCKTVEVKPFLGDLEWAEGALALPDGKAVRVRVEKTAGGRLDVKVDAPEGVKVVRGHASDLSAISECRPRDGLPNALAKLTAGETVRVAYLGGSITAANGWRPKSLDWFRQKFPKAKVEEINATISGTGSDYGAIRLRKEVLDHKPDLLFVEFRVNGSAGFDLASTEGIVRQTWTANPETDICFVYTLCRNNLQDLSHGRQTGFGQAMERVCDHYGIPSVDFAPEILARMKDPSTFVFEPEKDRLSAEAVQMDERAKKDLSGKNRIVFALDGVHPGDAGHEIYRDVLARSMTNLVFPASGCRGGHVLPKAITPKAWVVADTLPAADVLKGDAWTRIVDGRADAVYGDSYGRTEQMLHGGFYTTREGTTFSVRWTGSALGFSDIPQAKKGEPPIVIAVSIDGGKPIEFARRRTPESKMYSRFVYLPELPWGEHEAVFTVKSVPSGQRCIFGQFLMAGHR